MSKIASRINSFIFKKRAFTLVELLVVIGVISILSAATLIYLNPVEYLKQSRDSNRSQDLTTLNSTLNFGESQGELTYPDTTKTLYVSLVDSDPTCANLGLPTLSDGWQYHCATSTANLYNTDGTGWVPIDVSNIVGSFSLTNLPVDPINTVSSCEYLMFAYDGPQNWELASRFESVKFNQEFPTSDGGTSATLYEKGKNLTVLPSFTCTPTDSTPPPPSSVTISASNSIVDPYSGPDVPADGGSGGAIYFHIKDTNNQAVQGATITCSATPSTGASFNYSGPNSPISGMTDSNGDGWCSISSTVAEVKTVSITAQLGSDTPVTLNQTADVPFINPATIAQSTLDFPNGTSAPADGATVISALLTANNSSGQPVEGVRTFCNIEGLNGATTDGVTVIGDGAFTDSNGQVTCGYTSTQAGDYSMSITMGNDTMGPQTISFTSIAGIQISASASTVYVYDAQKTLPANGGNAQVYIQIIDTNGNNVQNAQTQIITDRPSVDNITQPNLTDSGGGSVGNFTSTEAGTSVVSVQARLGAGDWVTLDQTVTLTVTNGVDHTTLTWSPESLEVPADGVSMIKFTLTAYDVDNSPVQNAVMGCGISNNDDNSIQIFGAGQSTDINGQVKCMFASSVAKTAQVYFNDVNNNTVQTKDVTFTEPTGQATKTFTVDKSQALADGSDSITGTMTIIDSNGVAQSEVPIECKVNPDNGNTSISYSNNAVTDSNGQATCSINSIVEQTVDYSAWTAPSNRDYQVQIGDTQSITFTNSPGGGGGGASISVSNSTVTVDKSSAIADGTDSITATITLKDDSNNSVSGTQTTCSVSGSDNTVSTPALTDANGQTVCVINSTTAEDKTITVTVGTDPSTLFTNSFETNPISTDGWTYSQVSGTTADWIQTDRTDLGDQNNIGPQDGTYMMDFESYYSSQGDTARLYNTGGFAFPSSYTSVSLSFWMFHETSWPDARDSVQVQASTDGGTTWQNVGNPVYRYDGTNQWTHYIVDLSGITGSTNNVSIGFLGTGDYGNDEFIDNISVVATQNSATLNDQPTVTFTNPSASVSASNSIVSVDKSSAVADGIDSITATITLKDDSGNPISGITPTCNVSGDNNTVSTPDPTNSDGQTICVTTSTAVEDKTITVTADGVTLDQTVNISFVDPISSSNSTVTLSKDTIDGYGTDSATATITVKDGLNNPVQGVYASCYLGPYVSIFVSDSSSTDANGQTTCSITGINSSPPTITLPISVIVYKTPSFSDGFEDVNFSSLKFNNWVDSATSTHPAWVLNYPSYEGSHDATLNGVLSSSLASDFMYNTSSIPFSSSTIISFWYYAGNPQNSVVYRQLQLRASTDNGSTWQNVSPLFGTNLGSIYPNQWKQSMFDLSGIASSSANMMIGFYGQNQDTSNNGSYYIAGPTIDKVQVINGIKLDSQPILNILGHMIFPS